MKKSNEWHYPWAKSLFRSTPNRINKSFYDEDPISYTHRIISFYNGFSYLMKKYELELIEVDKVKGNIKRLEKMITAMDAVLNDWDFIGSQSTYPMFFGYEADFEGVFSDYIKIKKNLMIHLQDHDLGFEVDPNFIEMCHDVVQIKNSIYKINAKRFSKLRKPQIKQQIFCDQLISHCKTSFGYISIPLVTHIMLSEDTLRIAQIEPLDERTIRRRCESHEKIISNFNDSMTSLLEKKLFFPLDRISHYNACYKSFPKKVDQKEASKEWVKKVKAGLTTPRKKRTNDSTY